MNDFDDEQPSGGENDAPESAPETTGSGFAPEAAVSGEPTPEQKREVARWINEGVGLSDVQKRLSDEFGITKTYMEVRFLVDDLDLDLLDEEEEEEDDDGHGDGDEVADSEGAVDPEDEGAGGVSVSVDKVTRPGVMASGIATFTDGVECPWYLDQFGRLGLMPKEEGYKPPEEDLQDFQQKLDEELRRSGI